jgi:predicted DNA-binding transcriptional regulator YafY
VAAKRTDADRRLRQNIRLARVLRVLQLLQGRGRWNAKSIAAELECSERTVYRDLSCLELAGIPWAWDEEERCYKVCPDFRFPALNLTEDELLDQATATAITTAAGLAIGAGFRPTTRKLAAVSNEEVSKLLHDAEQLVAVLDLKLADHSRHQEMIKSIQWALLRKKQLVGQYKSPYETQSVKLTLHPYRLCLVKQCWYLIATPTRENQPRTYRVTRFNTST